MNGMQEEIANGTALIIFFNPARTHLPLSTGINTHTRHAAHHTISDTQSLEFYPLIFDFMLEIMTTWMHYPGCNLTTCC